MKVSRNFVTSKRKKEGREVDYLDLAAEEGKALQEQEKRRDGRRISADKNLKATLVSVPVTSMRVRNSFSLLKKKRRRRAQNKNGGGKKEGGLIASPGKCVFGAGVKAP